MLVQIFHQLCSPNILVQLGNRNIFEHFRVEALDIYVVYELDIYGLDIYEVMPTFLSWKWLIKAGVAIMHTANGFHNFRNIQVGLEMIFQFSENSFFLHVSKKRWKWPIKVWVAAPHSIVFILLPLENTQFSIFNVLLYSKIYSNYLQFHFVVKSQFNMVCLPYVRESWIPWVTIVLLLFSNTGKYDRYSLICSQTGEARVTDFVLKLFLQLFFGEWIQIQYWSHFEVPFQWSSV